MKTTTFAVVASSFALLLGACSSSRTASDSARQDGYSGRAFSGGSMSSSSAVPAGNTMNDRDKMLEMCQSLRTTKSCDEIVQECSSATDRSSCLQQYAQ